MRTISPILILCLSFAAHAQEPASAELINDPFVENYDPEVSVSGNVVVGIMMTTAAAAIANDQVALVRSARQHGEQICLKAVSRDGIYTSRNVYALPDSAATNIRLPYQSSLNDIVSDYGEHEIALSATAGDCDSGATDYYVLRSAAGNDDAEIVMYLNSFGATDIFVETGGTIAPCEYISEGRRTTFDFICPLNVGVGEDTLSVSIIRERFGREQPPVSLRVIGAGL